jgi:hypothetical protein
VTLLYLSDWEAREFHFSLLLKKVPLQKGGRANKPCVDERKKMFLT